MQMPRANVLVTMQIRHISALCAQKVNWVYMYGRDIHVKWQFYCNIFKIYMIALSDDTKTKFIGGIVFELHLVNSNLVNPLSEINRPEL